MAFSRKAKHLDDFTKPYQHMESVKELKSIASKNFIKPKFNFAKQK